MKKSKKLSSPDSLDPSLLDSSLFPALRNANGLPPEARPEKPVFAEAEPDDTLLSHIIDIAEASEASLPNNPVGQTTIQQQGNDNGRSDEDGDPIPALFGGVHLDRHTEESESESESKEPCREPYNEYDAIIADYPFDLSGEEEPLPVPSLFSGIGRDYYPSDEVMRLASECGDDDITDEDEPEEDAVIPAKAEPEPIPEEPPLNEEELLKMIGSCSLAAAAQEEELRKRATRVQRNGIPDDPYNTAFNDREHYDPSAGIDEIPMEDIYKLGSGGEN